MFRCVLLAVAAALSLAQEVCLPSSSEIEIAITGTLDGPSEGSCCQEHICGLPCPEPVPEPGVGYGIAVGVSIAISFIIGILTIFVVKGESENFFVAGRSLPLWIVAMTLGAQSIDSNALLGNVDLSYKYHFYDGGKRLKACLMLVVVESKPAQNFISFNFMPSLLPNLNLSSLSYYQLFFQLVWVSP
jgi:hypothetical protein